MSAATINLTGNLTGDPELRVTQNGHSVAAFSVAVTDRVRKGEAWEDGTTSFFRVTCWKALAEHVAGSLHKGDRVHVAGSIGQRDWEDKDGVKRTSYDVTAHEVGASLAFRDVEVKRTERTRPVAVPA